MTSPPSVRAILFELVPAIAVCFSVPLWDRVYPMVLGMPFNLSWLILWLVLAPLCMWGAYRSEVRRSLAATRDKESATQ